MGHAAAALDQARNDPVNAIVTAQGVVDRIAISEQLGELAIQLVDGVRGVGSQSPHGASDARAITHPDLKSGIVRPYEKRVGSVGAGTQHRHGIGLVEPGQIPEGGRLPEFVVDIVIAGCVVPRGKDDRTI